MACSVVNVSPESGVHLLMVSYGCCVDARKATIAESISPMSTQLSYPAIGSRPICKGHTAFSVLRVLKPLFLSEQ